MKTFFPPFFTLIVCVAPSPVWSLNAPLDGDATAAGPASIALHWVDDSTDESGFEIERDSGGGYAALTNVSANIDHFYNRGLAPGSTLSYRVRAVGNDAPSAWLELGSATTTPRMNILFLLADDMGYKDIVALRNPDIDGPTIYETPALDTLAAQSLIIDNAYCSGPRCVVARRTVLTGKYDWRPEAVPSNNWYLDADNNPDGGGIFAGGLSVNPSTAGQAIPDNETYGEAVQAAGYRTCYIGKYHLGQFDDQPARGPAAQGFDVSIAAGHAGAPPESYFPQEEPAGSGNYTYYLPNLADTSNPNEYLTDRLTQEAIGFIGDSITNHPAQPFFLTLAHYAVHTPIEAKQSDIDYFTAKKSAMAAALATHPMAGTPLLTDQGAKVRQIQDNRVYAAMMKSYDDSLASLRAYLAATDDPRNPGMKLSDTTVIVVSSDHGGKSTSPLGDNKPLENDATDAPSFDGSNTPYNSYPTSNYPYRHGKTWVYEGGLKIPLIVYYPGLTTPGSRTEALVHGADFFATFVDIAGAPQQPTNSTDSVSFMLSAAQPDASARKNSHHFFTNANKGTGNPAIAAYRKGDYKLFYFMVQRRLELYNVAADPYERNDLAPSRPDMAREMFLAIYRQHLSTGNKMPKPGSNTWLSEQNDVLVYNGLIPSVPPPPNAAPSWVGAGVTLLSPTSLELEWTVNATNATHSIIYRRADAEGETSYREWAYVPVNVTTFRDTNLVPGGQYRYRVESENLGGWAPGNTGNKNITLPGVGAPLPLALQDDTITTLPDESRCLDPRINDEGEGALSIIEITQPSAGRATYDHEWICFETPAGFGGTNVTMTYTVEDDAGQTNNATITFTLPVQPVSETNLVTFPFNDAPGTSLENSASTAGIQFNGTPLFCTVDGTNLVLTSGPGSSTQNRDAGPLPGAPYTTGRFRMEFAVRSVDFSNSAPHGQNTYAGFGLRDNSAGSNFGVLRIREQNDALKLEIRTTNNNELVQIPALYASNLVLATTLDLDAGMFYSEWSTNNGVSFSIGPDIAIDDTAQTLDTLRFSSRQDTNDWHIGDSMVIDYVSVSMEVASNSLYEAWATAYPWFGILATDPYEDADADGWINLIEFALGLSPTIADSISPFRGTTVAGEPVVQFTPARDTSRIEYAIHFSEMLEDWSASDEVAINAPAGTLVTEPFPDAGAEQAYSRLVVREP